MTDEEKKTTPEDDERIQLLEDIIQAGLGDDVYQAFLMLHTALRVSRRLDNNPNPTITQLEDFDFHRNGLQTMVEKLKVVKREEGEIQDFYDELQDRIANRHEEK